MMHDFYIMIQILVCFYFLVGKMGKKNGTIILCERRETMKYDHEDSRFRFAHKEALIGLGLACINFVIWYGFAYGLGSKDPSEYTYIFGFPAWFFL